MILPTSRALPALALALLSSPAEAGTFVVDDDGGADFTEINAAVASPLVADGDLILVRPGTYQLTTVTKALTIIGLGETPDEVTLNSIRVEDLPAGLPAHVANLEAFSSTAVRRCVATVVYHDVQSRWLTVEDCDDFRASGLRGTSVALPGCEVDVTGSHVELVACTLRGRPSMSQSALFVGPASYARVADCDLRGGTGTVPSGLFGDDFGGNGGHGAWVSGELFASGSGNLFRGGTGGLGVHGPSEDGFGGNGLRANSSSVVRLSGVVLEGGTTPTTGTPSSPLSAHTNATVVQPDPPDPSLVRGGSTTPGEAAELRVLGEAGVPALIFASATPGLATAPDLLGVVGLGAPLEIVVFGVLDASGAYVLPYTVPTDFPPGFVAWIQALTVSAEEPAVRLANSLPVLFF